MASTAACDHSTYTGIAPGAGIIDAGFDYDAAGWPSPGSQENAVEALEWAIQDQDAPIVNFSMGAEVDDDMNWLDQAFDYWARTELTLITKSSGDLGGSISSPGKAWNIITVGGSDDDQTADWSDDDWWSGSGYVNPADPLNNDREKPEVVAPARSIVTIGLGGNPTLPSDGTSLSAPQVAGLAALLIDRNGSLESLRRP